jgi:low temperature requirement protein LtrA
VLTTSIFLTGQALSPSHTPINPALPADPGLSRRGAAFGLATFAICWAWINFSWFASAYDTDDWAFGLATMVQIVGVIILALGLPQVFRSIDQGQATS